MFRTVARRAPGKMNKTEERYAAHLEAMRFRGEIAWWAFEAVTFKLAHDTRYTPDFMVLTASGELQAHEVKGSEAIFTDDAKVKIKVAAELFPVAFSAWVCGRGGTWERWAGLPA